MDVNEPNLSQASGSSATGAARARQTDPDDDLHFSELLRSLRALAAASPERQARIESIARAYAQGSYEVDVEATASRIIDDSLTQF